MTNIVLSFLFEMIMSFINDKSVVINPSLSTVQFCPTEHKTYYPTFHNTK